MALEHAPKSIDFIARDRLRAIEYQLKSEFKLQDYELAWVLVHVMLSVSELEPGSKRLY
jgi:hypothetical protein